MVEQEATEEEKKLMQTIYERYDLEDEWALEQLRAHVQCEVEKSLSFAKKSLGKEMEEWHNHGWNDAQKMYESEDTNTLAKKYADQCKLLIGAAEQQAVEKALAQKEDEFKCREIVAYEEGLAEHTDDEKKAVEKAMGELREVMKAHALICHFNEDDYDAIREIDARWPEAARAALKTSLAQAREKVKP